MPSMGEIRSSSGCNVSEALTSVPPQTSKEAARPWKYQGLLEDTAGTGLTVLVYIVDSFII